MSAVPIGYKQTEVGVIPEDWEVRALLAAVRIANGQVDPRDEPYKSMILVAPDHIEGRTGRLLDQRTATEQKAISGKYCFSTGDIVYSKIRPYLRKAVLADFSGLCSADMYPLRSAVDVEAGFMLPILLGERFSSYAESVSARSGMPKINRAELAEYSFALPPLPEQRAIAAALSDVDALLAKLDQFIAKKRDLKQAAMQQLLTGQSRLPGFERKLGYKQTEVGLIPNDWDVIPIATIAHCLIGLTYSPNDVRSFGTLVLRSSNVQDGRIALKDNVYVEIDLPPRVITRQGDILICVRNGSRQLIGKCAMIDTTVAGSAFGAFMAVLRSQSSAFLFQQFQSSILKRQISEGMGATINQITNKDMASFQVIWPNLEAEQTAIATVLSDMDAELAKLEARRDQTRALKQGMMQELLTGRIRLV